ncbi:MAG TPA: thiamine pyrophosphate-dependent enzyme [Jatrophihabitantaceae bacterium]|nr:thiamine pyrophosphate-dependent enzyme [Jatrophihabitantaceae bacterium]
MDALASAIAASSRPIVFAGGGAIAGDDGAAVRQLACLLGAPVLTSNQGKGIGTWDDDQYLGPWGWEPAARELFGEADLALVFGSKLSASGTGQWQIDFPASSYRIGLPARAHPRYPQLRDVAGDAAAIALQLTETTAQRAPWARERVREIRTSVLAAAAERGTAEMACVTKVATAASSPSWVTLDMTKAAFWFMKYLPARIPRAHLISSYLAMGTALPMAIGTAAATQQPCLAVVGDGGFQMSVAELGTLAEHQLPVTVLIVVDGLYGLLRDNRVALGDQGMLGIDLWNPELAMLADAYGIPCHHAADAEALGDVLSTPSSEPRIILLSSQFSRAW